MYWWGQFISPLKKRLATAWQRGGREVVSQGGVVVQCQGPSMMPTFNESGDIIAIEHWSRLSGRLRKGDVVIVRSPQDPTHTVCKRIIAMEGEFVAVDTDYSLAGLDEYVKIPKGHIWLQGDNSENSTDSRQYGPIPLALVCGRVFFK
eukprot:Ihof_evm2s601 gene=Ihof_evmTU2s601